MDQKSLDNDIKEYINYIAIIQYTYSTLMDDTWTLGQDAQQKHSHSMDYL